MLSSRADGHEQQQDSIKVLDVSKALPESPAASRKKIKDEYIDKFKDTVVIKAVERDSNIIRRAGGSQKLHLELHSGPEMAGSVGPFARDRSKLTGENALEKVGARVKSFREKKTTWVPTVNRIQKRIQPNIAQPEYYSQGRRMNPTKLIYNIKLKVDRQIEESNGQKQKEDLGDRGVDNRESYHRFSSQYLVSPRGHTEPLPDVGSGTEYTRNVELIGKMLNHHTEFQEAMNRKIHIVSKGEKISTSSMNPVMAGKVADAIRQLDHAHSQN